MLTIDITKLSPAQLLELSKAAEQLTAQKKREREQNIAAYKAMVDETVVALAPDLASFGTLQGLKVEKTFNAFQQALALKKELYDYKDSQASHTFTSRDGMASVTIGHNEIIGFDGTENAGVIKIREYMTTLADEDPKRKILVRFLETFMKPNKKGELNPARIVELIGLKEEANDTSFSDGVDIIVNAQFKTRTSTYVKGWFRRQDGEGKDMKLEFSISTK